MIPYVPWDSTILCCYTAENENAIHRKESDVVWIWTASHRPMCLNSWSLASDIGIVKCQGGEALLGKVVPGGQVLWFHSLAILSVCSLLLNYWFNVISLPLALEGIHSMLWYCCHVFLMLRMKPRASYILIKHFITQSHPSLKDHNFVFLDWNKMVLEFKGPFS